MKMHRLRLSRGFTMIEVLVAIGIMTMISMLIFSSFSSLKRSKDGVRRVSERYREGRMAMSRVTRELQSAYISRHLPIDENQIVSRSAFIGEAGSPGDRVDFAAFVHRRMDRDARESDQAEVGYLVMENPNEAGVFDLVRRESAQIDLEPQSGGRGQVLATDVDLFDLMYLDPLTGRWEERWNSTEALGQLNRLPLQVRMLLILNGGSRAGSDQGRKPITFAAKVSLPIQQALTFAIQ